MTRITYWILSTISVLVLLFGYHTSTAGSSGASTAIVKPISGSASASTGATTPSATPSPAPAATSRPTASATPAAKTTVTGDVVQTQWGPVQVQLAISNKKIANVEVLQYPDGNGRDAQINSYALPTLIQETLSAQSADIDMVSGATYTSDGYIQSLQSALDKANL